MQMANTHIDALARTYALALFEASEHEGGEDRVEEIAGELDEILELSRSDRSFSEFLRSRILPVKQRAGSLRLVFEGRISDLTLRFLLVLNKKGRLGQLESIAAGYDQILQERFGRVEVDVYTTSPIDRAQFNAIGERLRGSLGKEPVLHAYTDESMLGGLKLQIGDQLIDASVSTQLRKIRDRLSQEGSSRIRAAAERFYDETE